MKIPRVAQNILNILKGEFAMKQIMPALSVLFVLTLSAPSSAYASPIYSVATQISIAMTQPTAVDYAVKRFKTHLHRFDRFAGMLERHLYDEHYLREVTTRDSLFPDMDYRIFQNKPWL